MDLARVLFFWDFKIIHKKTVFLLSPQEFRLIRSFTIPENEPVLQNIMAFAIKAGGHDQIDRFVKERAIMDVWISSALWGACIGFASLPKTFTNTIYDSKNEQLLNETDDYLFTCFLNKI